MKRIPKSPRWELALIIWEDYAFRTMALSVLALAVNCLLAVSKGVAGWFLHSRWLIILSGYYVFLSVGRFILLKHGHRLRSIRDQREKALLEWKTYRLSGILMMLMMLVLQSVVIFIVREGAGFYYQGALVYAVAVYDVACLTIKMHYLLHRRRQHSPLIQAVKNFSLACSLVSILSLQTALFASFGGQNSLPLQRRMNTILGTVVCLTLLATGMAMLRKGTSEIRKLQESPVGNGQASD